MKHVSVCVCVCVCTCLRMCVISYSWHCSAHTEDTVTLWTPGSPWGNFPWKYCLKLYLSQTPDQCDQAQFFLQVAYMMDYMHVPPSVHVEKMWHLLCMVFDRSQVVLGSVV